MSFIEKMLLVALLVLIPTTLFAQKQTAVLPALEPTEGNYDDWKSNILPAEKDLVWRNVAWLTTFGDGIAAANEADKPLLLWVMNGHPFGCT